MIARCISYSDEIAVFEMVPSRIARWFGARTTRVTLGREKMNYGWSMWRCPATDRKLGYFPHSTQIEHALTFREVAEIPRATGRLRLVDGAPK